MEIYVFEQVADILEMPKQDAEKNIKGEIPGTGKKFTHFDSPVSGEIVLDYPLTNPYKFSVNNIQTVGELSWLIAQAYMCVYECEEETSPQLVEELDGNCLNRGKTEGDYGIWGHGITDLFLEVITIQPGNKIKVFIGS